LLVQVFLAVPEAKAGSWRQPPVLPLPYSPLEKW
jgi:hypothetical protein